MTWMGRHGQDDTPGEAEGHTSVAATVLTHEPPCFPRFLLFLERLWVELAGAVFFFFSCGTRLELKAYTLSHSTSPFL
jgi:hypothetical protein